MNSRERIHALLCGRTADRVGLMDTIWGDTLAAWVGQGYPTRLEYKELGDPRWRKEDGRWVKAVSAGEYEEPVPPWEHFGYDMEGIGSWFDILPLRGVDELVEETAEWEIRRDGAGASFKYWKHKSGTPEHIDFRMTSREVWERDYRPHLLEFDPLRFDLRAQRNSFDRIRRAGIWVHFGHQFVWENMRQTMGDITLYENLLLDPGWIHDFNRVYTDFYRRAFTYMFEQIGLPDGIWLYEDLGYKNGLFASPKLLSKLVFPYFKELVDFFHGYDLPVVLHSCGSTAEALPLIVEAGFDALNPMERKANGNDPFVFAERYGDRLAFIGGLDARVLESNDRETIRREVAGYIDGMKSRGARLVFATDHSISTNTRYDSYCYALEVFREHMLYP